MNNVDKEYFRLARLVLDNGRTKHNRTGVDTIGVFGAQARFNLQEGLPVLTTKKVFTKGVIHELLWFLSGSTNIKYLVDNDVHIWDEWAYKRYLAWYKDQQAHFAKIGVNRDPWTQEQYIEQVKLGNVDADLSDLGEGTYGGMWRAFPYYSAHETLVEPVGGETLAVIDQIQKVMDKLKSNPDDRRMIVSAWHPYWVDHCALPPCHCLFHFNTEELTEVERLDLWQRKFAVKNPKGEIVGIPSYLPNLEGEDFHKRFDKDGIPRRRLNCLLYQRSCDLFLGVPFNILSYSILTQMVAHCVNMVPGEFVHTYGDLHIYKNHIDQINLQMTREPMKLPTLWLNPDIRDIFKFKYEDIRIDGYQSHPAIKGEVAV